MALDTPVAFIIFNRPDLTQQVFQAIRKAQPKKLLVIADGPRFPEEQEKCAKTRAVIDGVDWDCEVLKNYSEINLSSPIRCSSGLNWIFDQVSEAIILEDDCLPAQSFFQFCQTLLEKYRDDERIMHISGNNFQFGQSRTPYSYYFSKYAHNWGWATWRRAWQHFDFELCHWPETKAQSLLKAVCEDSVELEYWSAIFDACFDNKKFHWDYSWQYACWVQNGLSIIPDVNLVSNIGFRSDATRTKSPESKLSNIATYEILEVETPDLLVRNQIADLYTFDHIFEGNTIRLNIHQKNSLRQKLISIKRRMLTSNPIYRLKSQYTKSQS